MPKNCKELFDLRLKHGAGSLENNQKLRLLRKELACALTVQGEGSPIPADDAQQN